MDKKKMIAFGAAMSLMAIPALGASPFSDLPQGHWAYDAVKVLNARGLLTGYPDGTFRGNKPMSRYEIATLVARAAVTVDGVDDEVFDQLKLLVLEFAPELEALGVQVDRFDGRLSSLERGVGDWKLSGQMRFDYSAYDYGGDSSLDDGDRRTGFTADRARIFLSKNVGRGISFDARYNDGEIDRCYLTVGDFMDTDALQLRLGQFEFDWEGEDALYTVGSGAGDAWFTDYAVKGAGASYSKGVLDLAGFLASGMEKDGESVYKENASDDVYGARIRLNPCGKWWASVNLISYNDDGGDPNFDTYWLGSGFRLGSGAELKGAYYLQDISGGALEKNGGELDNPAAWKVILDMDDSILKYTSLWVEYDHFDEGFTMANHANHGFETKSYALSDWYDATGSQFNSDHDVYFIHARQKWTPRTSTFLEVEHADADSGGSMTRLGIGAGYRYTPAMYFELAYSAQDGHCSVEKDDAGYEDNIVRFRTVLNF